MTSSGDDVPGYRLRGMLSEGHGRRLHRAEALGSPGRPLMIEIHDIAVEEGTLARLRRQTDAVRDLGHPGLLPVREVVPLPEGIALVLPAAVGGSLTDVIDAPADADLDASALTAIASAARAAVAAAHANGLHHGALTADQVRFDAGGAPLLLGFGTGALRDTGASGEELQRKDRADLERLLDACSRDVAGRGAEHDVAPTPSPGTPSPGTPSSAAPASEVAVTDPDHVRPGLVLAAAAVLATPLLLVMLALSGG